MPYRPNIFDDQLSIDPNTVSLRPLAWRDALTLPGLTKANQQDPDFLAEFPHVASRHSSLIQSLRSIIRTSNSPDVSAWTIRANEVWVPSPALWHGPTALDKTDYRMYAPNPLIRGNQAEGLATIQRRFRVGEYTGSLVAGWIDWERRGQGVGKRAAQLLMERVDPGIVMAMTRPENEAATKIITKLGFEPVEEPRDYSEQVGDGVTALQQLYVMDKEDDGKVFNWILNGRVTPSDWNI